MGAIPGGGGSLGGGVARVLNGARALTLGAGTVGNVAASRASTAIAGHIWTRSSQSTAVWRNATNGPLWIQNGVAGYRASALKGRFGPSSNLTYGIRGSHLYANMHVVHRRFF
jgi:hypothetical protein